MPCFKLLNQYLLQIGAASHRLIIGYIGLRVEVEDVAVLLRLGIPFEELYIEVVAGVLDDEVEIASSDQEEAGIAELSYLPYKRLDRPTVVDDVLYSALEVVVTLTEENLHARRRYRVLDLPVVHLFYGKPALIRQPLEDGIGHPEGQISYSGEIPLAHVAGGVIDVFEYFQLFFAGVHCQHFH